MRKSFWIILTSLFVSIGASDAKADSSTVTFQCTGTCDSIPIATNNPVSLPFPTIDVTWEGIDFVLTFYNPIVTSDTYVWTGNLNDYKNLPGNTYPVDLVFGAGDSTTGFGALSIVNTVFEGSVPRGEVADTGTVVFTPEPGSLALMLAGFGLVFMMHKVMGHRLPRTS